MRTTWNQATTMVDFAPSPGWSPLRGSRLDPAASPCCHQQRPARLLPLSMTLAYEHLGSAYRVDPAWGDGIAQWSTNSLSLENKEGGALILVHWCFVASLDMIFYQLYCTVVIEDNRELLKFLFERLIGLGAAMYRQVSSVFLVYTGINHTYSVMDQHQQVESVVFWSEAIILKWSD